LILCIAATGATRMSEGQTFDSVLPTVESTRRPRTRGARRRAPPTPDVFESVFSASASAHKKSKTTPQKKLAFPKMEVSDNLLQPTGLSRIKTSAAGGHGKATSTSARDALATATSEQHGSLLQRLQASGIQRSHVQTILLPSVSSFASPPSNQQDSDERCLSPRPVRHDTTPLATQALALHPSANGILIPTRPVTTASTTKPDLRALAAATGHPTTPRAMLLSSSEALGDDSSKPVKKMPLTARDRFYMEQRAITAPMYGSGQSPRGQRRPLPTAPSATPRTENPLRRGRVVQPMYEE